MRPAWISGAEGDEEKKKEQKLFVALSALDYVKFLKKLHGRDQEQQRDALLYYKTAQDRQARAATKIELDLPQAVIDAEGITEALAKEHVEACSLVAHYENDELVTMSYGVYDDRVGAKFSLNQRPASTREGLIAQYTGLMGVAARMMKELQSESKEFKLVLAGDAPNYEKLPLPDLITALKAVCVANNIQRVNFWGQEWTNDKYDETLNADMSQDDEAASKPAGYRLRG